MPTYYYQARDQTGKLHKGSLEAESQTRAFSLLQAQGLLPLQLSRLSQSKPRARLNLSQLWLIRIKVEEAFYYLGLMLQGGSSLTQGLDLLGRMGSGRHARLWLQIRDRVESGQSFSNTLQEHSRLIPQVYIGMIQVAEKTGHLGQILERIASYEGQRREMQSRLLTALAYPLVVMLVGFGAIYFLLASILPRIAGIFETSDQELPTYTKLLLSLSQGLGDYGLALPVLLLGLGLASFAAYRKLPGLRFGIDARLWKIPLLRDIILARFSGLLAFQLTAGISLVQAMHGALQGVSSTFFQDRMQKAAQEVATGQSLDHVLARLAFLPQMYLTAIATGQRAGQLPGFLERISFLLEQRVDNSLRRIIGLLEPMLVLILGLVVGVFVLAIMGPIFDLTSQLP
ncbi:MAG: type II secretion system F family protein [Desulfohalobiaceae bacterium]